MTWKLVKLGDVCHLQNGFAFKSKLFKDKGLPILRISNIQNERIDTRRPVYFNAKDYNVDLKKYEVQTEDLLIAMSGATTGKIGFNKSQTTFYLNQRVGKLVPGKDLDKKYLYYLLTTKVEENLRISKGAAQPNLSSEQIKNIDIGLPPLPEQQRIVAKLDLIFAEIEKLEKKTTHNLNNINLFFKKSLDKIIENGEKKKLSDVADLIDSLHKTPKKYVEQGYPMVRVTDVKEGPLKFHKTKKVDKATFDEFTKRYTANIGDIVFSRVGSYGISSYVDSEESFCLGQNTVMIIPKINSKFLYYFLNSDTAKSQLKEKVSGVTQPTVSLKSIKEIILKVPEKKIQEKIVLKMDGLYDYKNNLIRNYNHKISSLRKLRNSFMAELLNKNNSEIV
jgi:type I restriction enzyme, S subunit